MDLAVVRPEVHIVFSPWHEQVVAELALPDSGSGSQRFVLRVGLSIGLDYQPVPCVLTEDKILAIETGRDQRKWSSMTSMLVSIRESGRNHDS